MVNVNTAFPSEYLKADDIWEMEVPVTISRTELRPFQNNGREEQRIVVFFEGKEKGLVLNVTNARTIAAMHGDETDEWRGRGVTLGTTWTDYQGRQVKAIRVRPGAPFSQPAQQPQDNANQEYETQTGGGDFEDPIPFGPETR